MKDFQNNEHVIFRFEEDGEIDKDRLDLENGTLVIDNYGDAYDHEMNYHKVSVEGLSKLKTLKRLVLSRFNLENFVLNNPIPKSIVALHLINCRFNDLNCIHNLTQLESFTFTYLRGELGGYKFHFQLSDYAPFQSLKALGLSGVLLRKIPSFDGLENLETLYLFGNMVPKMQNLEQFSKLEELHLQHNIIEKIENLDNAVQLKRLYINQNGIASFEGLEDLENLEYLDLNDNLFFQANKYQMPLREVKEHFGHLKKLIMLNGQLYPDNDYYTFERRGKDVDTWI